MRKTRGLMAVAVTAAVAALGWTALMAAEPGGAQRPGNAPGQGENRRPDFQGPGGPGGFGPGGPGGFGPGGFGRGTVHTDLPVLKRFDKDSNGYLDQAERQAARAALKAEQAQNPRRGPGGRGGRGPRFGGGENARPTPGAKVTPADVKNYPDAKLYDPGILRTFFLEFEDADWEAQLEEFHGTDVEVPATLVVDGKCYEKVGVSFRGTSSYMMVQTGLKRSLNISLDLANPKQRLYGYKTLNLLNSHEDSTFLHAPLFLDVTRHYMAAPKANFVKVVINGENWGPYSSVQQFNKEMLAEWYPESKGERWKVPGSPGGGGGLTYLGEDVAAYKRLYAIKTKDDPKSWQHLIALCKTLNQTPPDQLEAALRPMLDVDQALWYLALDITFINGDGYWTRGSDYNLFRDKKGVFHIIPHDANETFSPGMMGFAGPGRRGRGGFRPGGFGPPGGGPGEPGAGGARGGLQLDPLVAASDTSKPLASRLLAVPKFREQYLRNIRTIATEWLDWKKIGPVATAYHNLIDAEVKADTRRLSTYEAFAASLDGAEPAPGSADGPGGGFRPGPGGRRQPSIKAFVDGRREYLLNHPEIKKLSQ